MIFRSLVQTCLLLVILGIVLLIVIIILAVWTPQLKKAHIGKWKLDSRCWPVWASVFVSIRRSGWFESSCLRCLFLRVANRVCLQGNFFYNKIDNSVVFVNIYVFPDESLIIFTRTFNVVWLHLWKDGGYLKPTAKIWLISILSKMNVNVYLGNCTLWMLDFYSWAK